MGAYEDAYRRSLVDRAGFWEDAAVGVDWEQRWDQALDVSNPPHTRWFRGGKLNTCWNALDRHVAAGHGARIAIAYDSPVTKTKRNITYRELRDDVARFAGALRKRGVEHGDRVIMWYISGNRDERAIERPKEFLIDRKNARRHMSFGCGIHRCMGNRVGEMQLRILWEEILNRFDRIELVREPERILSNFVMGYSEVPVIVHAKAG